MHWRESYTYPAIRPVATRNWTSTMAPPDAASHLARTETVTPTYRAVAYKNFGTHSTLALASKSFKYDHNPQQVLRNQPLMEIRGCDAALLFTGGLSSTLR